jgi:hypothetical protein
MTVNPNLAALMRVIEENQDNMPEGEYLEAMNALGALHREIPAAAMGGGGAAGRPPPPPPSYAASAPLFQFNVGGLPAGMDIIEHAAWTRVKYNHPEHFGILAEDWMEITRDDRNRLLREATEMSVNRFEQTCQNPLPEECAFMARHAVGMWSTTSPYSWECVCGYKGLCKNGKKHEQSERHQDWAKHRTVSRRKIENMKKNILRDEAGELFRFNPLSPADLSGIRCIVVRQEKNEWTHPERYAQIHRSADPNGKWFVHHRELWARVYVQWTASA